MLLVLRRANLSRASCTHPSRSCFVGERMRLYPPNVNWAIFIVQVHLSKLFLSHLGDEKLGLLYCRCACRVQDMNCLRKGMNVCPHLLGTAEINQYILKSLAPFQVLNKSENTT